jgi:hypothetical protein
MGLEETGWEHVNRIILAQDRENLWAVVNKVRNFGIK